MITLHMQLCYAGIAYISWLPFIWYFTFVHTFLNMFLILVRFSYYSYTIITYKYIKTIWNCKNVFRIITNLKDGQSAIFDLCNICDNRFNWHFKKAYDEDLRTSSCSSSSFFIRGFLFVVLVHKIVWDRDRHCYTNLLFMAADSQYAFRKVEVHWQTKWQRSLQASISGFKTQNWKISHLQHILNVFCYCYKIKST